MYRLLIVEDEKVIAAGLSRLLQWERLGIARPLVLTDSKDAERILREGQTDIMITDINMPGPDGIELLETIKECGLKTRTIALSGYDEFDKVRRCFLLGVENYLLKPVNEKELEILLSGIVAKLDRAETESRFTADNMNGLRQHILHTLLLGIAGEEEIEAYRKRIDYDFDLGAYCVVVITLMDKKCLGGVAGHIGGKNGKQIQAVITAESEISVILAGVLPEQIQAFVSEMKAQLTTADIEFCISAGSLESDVRSLSESYYNAKISVNPLIADMGNPTVNRILKYIEDHYDSEITLSSLAEKFYFHPKYIGRLFKQGSGKNFSDYLCEYRIQKAKQLLIESDLKSFDIAGKVGFSDASYFTNVFKKVTGCYPSKYRALYRNHESGKPQ